MESKRKPSKFWIVFVLSMVFMLIVSACGGSSTPEGTVTLTAEATDGPEVESTLGPGPLNDNMCGSVEWEDQTDCTDNIATIKYNENIVVLALIVANPNPVVNGLTNLSVNVQITDGAGNFLAHADCYYDSAYHPNPQENVTVTGIIRTEEHEISCFYDDEVMAEGILRYFYGSNLAMTLTAIVPTDTSTPEAVSTMPTPTATGTPGN